MPTKVHLVKAMVFLVVRYGLERKLSARELMLSTVVLEKTLESLLGIKEIKPVNPKGNQPSRFIGRTDMKLKLHTLAK